MKWFHNSNHVRRQLWRRRTTEKRWHRTAVENKENSVSLSVSDLNRNCSPAYLFRQITTNCLLPFVCVFFRFSSACVLLFAVRCPLSFVNGSLSTLRLAHVLVWVALKLCLKPRDLLSLSLPLSLLALCSSWYRSLDSCPAWMATPLFVCSQPHTRTRTQRTHTLRHVLRVSSVINYYVSSPHLRVCVCVYSWNLASSG